MHQINNNNSTINRLRIKGILQEFSSWNSAVPESGKTVEGKSETDTISTRPEFYFRAHANNQHWGQVIYIKKKKKKATAVQWIELQTVDKGLKKFFWRLCSPDIHLRSKLKLSTSSMLFATPTKLMAVRLLQCYINLPVLQRHHKQQSTEISCGCIIVVPVVPARPKLI